MRSLILAACVLLTSGDIYAEQSRIGKCESRPEFESIRQQAPDFIPAYAADVAATTKGALRFKTMFRVLNSAKGFPVCIAVLVDDNGRALDAAAYYPKRVGLLPKERSELLSNEFTPSISNEKPVKSILVITASY